MKAKTRVILEMAIEEGVARGWRRAHKHTDSPSEQAVKDAIEDCVMAQIYEYFSFEDFEG